MNLAVCPNHAKKNYTLKPLCPLCNKPTSSAHYKYKDLKAPKHDTPFPER